MFHSAGPPQRVRLLGTPDYELGTTKVPSARETKQIQDDKIALTSHVITTLPQLLHKYLPDHLNGVPIAPMFSDFHEGFSTHKINVTRVLAHSNQPLLDIPGGGKLQEVLRHSGCKDEKICFIPDETNVMDSGFLEHMNTLLTNGEVPGLFEGDEPRHPDDAVQGGRPAPGPRARLHRRQHRHLQVAAVRAEQAGEQELQQDGSMPYTKLLAAVCFTVPGAIIMKPTTGVAPPTTRATPCSPPTCCSCRGSRRARALTSTARPPRSPSGRARPST